MSLPVVLRPEALDDLALTRDWYEDRRDGLGYEFLDEVAAALDRIGFMPTSYSLLRRGVRSCRVRRFPYLVYFRVLPDLVEVLAVLHGKMDEAAWQARI